MRLTIKQFFSFIFLLPYNSWEWFRPSIEGNDRKASVRRLSALALLVQGLMWVTTLCYRLLFYPTAEIPLATVWILIVLLTASLLLFGIVTAQQMIEALNGVNNYNAAQAASLAEKAASCVEAAPCPVPDSPATTSTPSNSPPNEISDVQPRNPLD